MGVIQVMSDALANQIAAGEVVERPASCVKELIENSLDAKAKRIKIEVEEGGIRRLSVEDDGVGMDEQDAVLAFSRHATSKIIHARDLTRIQTLGFRGEALAAIAAVSKVSLTTRQSDQTHGIFLRIEGTSITDGPKPVGAPPGTRIVVEDLFYNTPVRLKYLRSVQTEFSRIVDVVQRAALSRPDVAFLLSHEGRVVFQSSGRGGQRSVLAALLGPVEATQLLEASQSSVTCQVTAWLGLPQQARSNRNHAYLFLNHRPIRNLSLHQAVAAGYGTRLMVGKHPIYALFVDMDPILADVNIHPHKSEVRLSEERDVSQLITRMVENALSDKHLVPKWPVTSRVQEKISSYQVPFFEQNEKNQTTFSEAKLSVSEQSVGLRAESMDMSTNSKKNTLSHPLSQAYEFSVQPEAVLASESVLPSEVKDEEVQDSSLRERVKNWRLRPIGQALGMYVIAEDGESLYIIDQHAAHERILYEKFLKQMQLSADTMPLLTPLTFTLSASAHGIWMQHQELFASLGLDIEPFGGLDVCVRGVPLVWEGLDVLQLTQRIFDDLVEIAKQAPSGAFVEELRLKIVQKACKAAIKANHRLSDEEILALCEELVELDDPFHCPHGRPVLLELNSYDLEKGFRRIV